MNYHKIYDSLILKRLNEKLLPSEGYCEYHHIKPKSIYPELADDKSNIVALTAKEHYLAHRLLVKLALQKYGKDSIEYIKMFCAFLFISTTKHRNHISSRLYTKLRQEQSRLNSIRFSGKNNGMYGVHRYGDKNPCHGHRWMYNKELEKYVYSSEEDIDKYLKLGYVFKGRVAYIPNKFQKEQNRLKHLGKSPSIDARRKMSLKRLGKIRVINLKLDVELSINKEQLNLYTFEDGWVFGRLFYLKRRFYQSGLSIDDFYNKHIDFNTRRYKK